MASQPQIFRMEIRVCLFSDDDRMSKRQGKWSIPNYQDACMQFLETPFYVSYALSLLANNL